MTNFVSSISVDQVIEALAAFIQPLLPMGAEVVRAQVNRVALPSNPCVVLTDILEVDLSVPYGDFTPTNQTAIMNGPTRIDIQVDFYGLAASDYAKAFKQTFRSSWGYAQFPDTAKPLYTSDGQNSPLITGEQQYESRFTLTASMQYNPTVTVPQQSATALNVTVEVPADSPI